MARDKTVWVVIEEIEDEPDDTVVHVFASKKLAEKAVDYINGLERGLSAYIAQEQYVTTDFAQWQADVDEYLEKDEEEGEDEEEEG